MATVHTTIEAVNGTSALGGVMPVAQSIETLAETLTSSATSAAGTIEAPGKNLFWSVTVSGGDIWVKFGTDPTAASGSGYLMTDGQTRDFAVTLVGEKIAIKDA